MISIEAGGDLEQKFDVHNIEHHVVIQVEYLLRNEKII